MNEEEMDDYLKFKKDLEDFENGMKEEEIRYYMKFKQCYDEWMNYQRFKQTLQSLEPEEYEKAIKGYCKEHNL